MKNKRKKQKEDLIKYGSISIVLILITILVGPSLFFSSFDLADKQILTSSDTLIDVGDTIVEADGLKLYFTNVNIQEESIVANLHLSTDGSIVAVGTLVVSGYDSVWTWTFDLKDVYKGINSYYIATEETNPYRSADFNIIGDIDSPDSEIINPPTFSYTPKDRELKYGESVNLFWGVIYEGDADVGIYLGNSLLVSFTHNLSTVEEIYYYDFSSGTIDDFIIEFRFTPHNQEIAMINDFVVISVVEEVSTTPTTTTTTTTTEPTGTELSDEMIMIMGIMFIIMVSVVVVILIVKPVKGKGK